MGVISGMARRALGLTPRAIGERGLEKKTATRR
jgi:hypothetical protein